MSNKHSERRANSWHGQRITVHIVCVLVLCDVNKSVKYLQLI